MEDVKRGKSGGRERQNAGIQNGGGRKLPEEKSSRPSVEEMDTEKKWRNTGNQIKLRN